MTENRRATPITSLIGKTITRIYRDDAQGLVFLDQNNERIMTMVPDMREDYFMTWDSEGLAFTDDGVKYLDGSDDIFSRPNGNDGELMTLDEWREAVLSGAFNEYDGSGYFSNGTHYTRTGDVFTYAIPEGATHVLWFNK